MIVYADTSALVKLYIAEEGSSKVRELVSGDSVVTSIVTYAEIRATLARAARDGRMARSEFAESRLSVDGDWVQFTRTPLDERLVREAGDLADQFALTGFDAIHLASALRIQDESGQTIGFSAFDRRLNDAASKAGLTLH